MLSLRHFPYLQGTAVRYRVLTVVLRIAAYWFFQNGKMRLQESNYMYSSSTMQNVIGPICISH